MRTMMTSTIIAGSISACGSEETGSNSSQDAITREYAPYLPGDAKSSRAEDGGLPCSEEIRGTLASCEAGSTCLVKFRVSSQREGPVEQEGKRVEYASGKYRPFLAATGVDCSTGYRGTIFNCEPKDVCETKTSADPDELVIGVCRPHL